MIPSDTRGEGVTTSAHVGSDEVRVWQSDRYTCVYVRSPGAEATVALQRHDAWRIATAMVPEIERYRTDCSDALKAVHELKIEHREPAIQTLREVAGEIDCDSGCDHSFYDGSCNASTCDKHERGEFCGWMAAATLLDLADGLENHKRLTASQEAVAPPPVGGDVAGRPAEAEIDGLIRAIFNDVQHGRTVDPSEATKDARTALEAAFASLTTEIATLKRETARLRALLEVPAELREMSRKATKGEWRVETNTTLVWGDCIVEEDGGVSHMGVPVADAQQARGWSKTGQPDADTAEANAALSAAAVNFVRHLASTDSTETGEAERG